MKYWLQVKARSGNWSDSTGSDDLQSLRDHAKYLRKQGEVVQIVERRDVVVVGVASV